MSDTPTDAPTAPPWVAIDPGLRERLLAPPDPDGPPVDIVLDTDITNEIDDQFALVWAALRPDRVRIRALTACPYGYGPDLLRGGALLADLDAASLTATLARLGMGVDDVPVLAPSAGEARAHADLLAWRERLVGAGVAGAGDVPVHHGATSHLPDASTPVRSAAAEAMVALAHEDRGGSPLHLVGIGCATNLASALLIDPTIAERVVVVWTSAHPSYWPRPNASFNLAQDLPAARVLLDSGVPLVYLPGYFVGEELRTVVCEVEAHVAGRGPLGDELARLFRRSPLSGDRPVRSKVIWDLICLAWLIDHRWLATDLVPTPALGPDLRWSHPPGRHAMREAHDVDRDAVFADLFACLARQAGG